jgi:hypothetical protein
MEELKDYEYQVLHDWHRDQMWKFSDKQEFTDAAYHKQRAKEMLTFMELLKAKPKDNI